MTAHPTYSGCGLQPDRHGTFYRLGLGGGLRRPANTNEQEDGDEEAAHGVASADSHFAHSLARASQVLMLFM